MSPALSDYNYIEGYSSAERALGNNDSKVIGNNTKLVRNSDGTISVALHGHEIIRFSRSGTSISSAGYRTSTTKDRLNRYTPRGVSVVQRDFDWYLKRNGDMTEFRDGMNI